MEKNEFFIKKGEVKGIEVEGLVFKFRKVTADDELNWLDEYKERKVEKDDEGKDKVVMKENLAKLVKCKMRNIMEVPFSKEELKEICGIDKEFSEYNDADKDALFGQINPRIMNQLILAIDNSRSNQKKS